MRPVVVKLGGSTAQAAEMGMWADALAAAALPLVVVPGGGPFADQVRAAQKRMGFSDRAAHAMAILAMEQFAYVVLDGRPRLIAARTTGEMKQALESGRIPVWLPASAALAEPGIRQSWDITSDSLAAWLAGRLGAGTLVLIKQSSDFSGRDTVDSLRRRDVVDVGFAAMLAPDVELRLAGPSDAPGAAAALASGKLVGLPIRPAPAPARRTG